MTRFKTQITGLVQDDKGAAAIEYAMIVTLASVTIMAGLATFGGSLNSAFNSLATALANAL